MMLFDADDHGTYRKDPATIRLGCKVIKPNRMGFGQMLNNEGRAASNFPTE
jgi:hypothetical protein